MLKYNLRSADRNYMSDSVTLSTTAAVSSHRTPIEWPTEMGSMARQPILDLRGCVTGYELIFQNEQSTVLDANHVDAAPTILDNMVLFGLDRLTGGLPAFVRCNAEALIEQLVAVVPAFATVLEIPASLEVTPKLLGACRKLKNAGFRLALVDFAWSPVPHPLLDLVEFVKVDLRRVHRRERLRQWLEGTSVAMVADGVHSQEDYLQAQSEGFRHFQGPYFCKPEMIKDRKIPANQVFHIEILRQLFRDPLDLRTLCPLVMRDAALVYRVLRLVNSPICAIREPVSSIESAIMILGDVTFRRIATLAIQCALNEGRPPEILHTALVRARFCSQGARLCKLDPDEQYLLGMLSLLPAMLRLPMETLAQELPLSPKIRLALLGSPSHERSLLTWIECHEWDNASESQAIASSIGVDQQELTRIYVDALVWDGAAPDPLH